MSENEAMLQSALHNASRRISRLVEGRKILYTVLLCIRYAKNEGTLPDVFDAQLCEGIERFIEETKIP